MTALSAQTSAPAADDLPADDAPVHWSMDRGWLTAKTAGGQILDSDGEPAADVRIDGRPFVGRRNVPVKVKNTPNGGFEVTRPTAAGRLVDRYEPFAPMGKNAWLRTLVYVNRSDKTQDLCDATMRVLPVPIKGATPWNPRDFWMSRGAGDKSVCISYRGSTDSYRLGVDKKYRVFHRITACWRLAPGERATIGAQGIWLADGGEDVFRQEAQRWFTAIDLHIPKDMPQWLPETILYEVCAGGHIDSRFSDLGGFDRLRRQVDYLADLGINGRLAAGPRTNISRRPGTPSRAVGTTMIRVISRRSIRSSVARRPCGD